MSSIAWLPVSVFVIYVFQLWLHCTAMRTPMITAYVEALQSNCLASGAVIISIVLRSVVV